jgi:hypothetical protein
MLKGLWFFCHAHRTIWYAGFDLFSSWRDQAEKEQRINYARLGLDGYEKVDPEE